MKLNLNIRNILIFSLFLLFSIMIDKSNSLSQFQLFRQTETCLRPCTMCQNTLYHLKFHSNVKCSNKECPGMVL